MTRLFEAFFVARLQPGAGEPGAGAAPPPAAAAAAAASNGAAAQHQRSVLFCRFTPPDGGAQLPADDNLSPFCWPLGAEAVRPSPFLVTAEFSFTLTGGDGSRLHGVCRRTADPTHRAPAAASGRPLVEQKRMPQVICILSQHCWQPFFSKVLEVADQLLAPHAACRDLPPGAPAALFLASLPRALVAAGPPLPRLGAVLRVPLPYSAAPISVDRMRRALAPPPGPGGRAGDHLLGLWPDAIELEVPPDLGNSAANAGISLARLLWFLTPRQAVTLVASLLLERRVILVARDADTVSAAVHAANALLYPFRWQHIYLPLLPLALKDYLAAPMPYLVGIQAECLPALRGMALEETVLIDLDRLGSCTPPLGSPGDDYFLLPFARELEGVFEVVREHIQSPTEFDSTPKCTELLQDFFLRLVGGYRKFVRPDEEITPAALALGLDRVAPPPDRGAASLASSAGSVRSGGGGANGKAGEEEIPRAHGYVFDQPAFILSHKRKDKIVAFLQQFRNSQMLEVFITERLKLASEGYVTDDPFEQKVAERATRLGVRLGIPGVGLVAVGGSASKGRIGSLLRKAGSAVKQGSAALSSSIKQLGSQQHEAEAQVTGRSHSNPVMGPSISPSAHGLGLARRSPAPAATSLVAHSRASSFTGSSRSSSHTNLASQNFVSLARISGTVPSLEQLRPDMFFGSDDEDDDSSSVSSRVSQEPPATGAARTAGSAGPLGAGMGASRSFGSLFHASMPPAVQQQPLPPLQQHQQQLPAPSPLGSRAASLQHVASRLGTGSTEASEQQQPQPADAAAAALAASPPLLDLASPGLSKPAAQQAYPRPQQLFPEAAAPVKAGGSAAGWATFDEPAGASGQPFGSPQAGSGRARTGGSPALDAAAGPLGAGFDSSVVRQISSGLGAAAAAAAVATAGGDTSASPPPQPQWQGWQAQQAAPPLLHQELPSPQWQHEWQGRQPHLSPNQQQQQHAAPERHVPLLQLPAEPASTWATASATDGVTTGWAAYGAGPLAGSAAGPLAGGADRATAGTPPPALPAACRQTAHSPLAAGMPQVHRIASLPRPEARRTSSSGASVVSGSGGGSSLGGPPDAFLDLASAGAADAALHMPSRKQTQSSGGGEFRPALRSSTSSWAEFEAAPHSGNPFEPAPPPTAVLPRQLTASARSNTSEWGEWAAPGALASQLSGLRLN